MTLPNFLGIGAQKAGTTWLHYHLTRHPEIWLPPIKEVHYFDRDPRYRSTQSATTPYGWGRYLGRSRTGREVGRRLRDSAIALQRREWDSLAWICRNALRRYDDDWYLSIFRAATQSKAAGEITPSYAMLALEDVKRIHNLLPDAKILFIMRDPVDRAWSHIRFAGLGKASVARQIKFIESPDQGLRSDYLRTLDTWQSVYPSEQFYIGFFDHIVEAPEEMLRAVCRFLGVDASLHWLNGSLRKPIHATSDQSGLPPELASHLAQKYRPQIEALAQRFDGPPVKWLQRAAAPQAHAIP